jgi:hypothetical protein
LDEQRTTPTGHRGGVPAAEVARFLIAFSPANPTSQSSKINRSGTNFSRARMPRLASGSSSTISTLYFIDSMRPAVLHATESSESPHTHLSAANQFQSAEDAVQLS